MFERLLAPRAAQVADRAGEVLLDETRAERIGRWRRREGRGAQRSRVAGSLGCRRRRAAGVGVLREDRFHFAKQLVGVERLRHDRIAAEPFGPLTVERLERPGEQDDRDARGRRVLLDLLADLVAVLLGHHDVGENEIGRVLPRFLESEPAVRDARQQIFGVGEHQLDDFLNGQAVVGHEDLFSHRCRRRYAPPADLSISTQNAQGSPVSTATGTSWPQTAAR